MSKRDSTGPGTLYVVATPIGNLDDITYRAVKTLSEADIVAAEDTRTAKILFSRFGIHVPLVSYHAANQSRQAQAIVDRLLEGNNVALISESGTPGVSDPGHLLVAKAVENGIRVVPIPGASASIAAVMASGMPSYVFTFYGFAPPKGGKRKRAFEAIARIDNPVIMYESPHRIRKTLDDMMRYLGDRNLIIGRELTKIHEEFLRLTVGGAIEHFAQTEPRGEFVIIVMPGDRQSPEHPEDDADSAETEDN